MDTLRFRSYLVSLGFPPGEIEVVLDIAAYGTESEKRKTFSELAPSFRNLRKYRS